MDKSYWQRAFEIGSGVYRDKLIDNVDEQAGPAYFATSGLSRWLFWQRLKWAAQQIDQLSSSQSNSVAVDFGCGFGLMLPHLRECYQTTIGVDLFPSLAEEFMRRWDIVDANLGASRGRLTIVNRLLELKLAGTVDLIVALDVLEHFESLDEIIEQLFALLKPGGRMLVSGPTESWLYKLGRRIVGFSGDYHHQTIYDVHAGLERKCSLKSVKALPPVLPLFLMSLWSAKAQP